MSTRTDEATITVSPARGPIASRLVPEGDKSITHRALFLGSLNRGTTTIVAPSLAIDCRSSRHVVEALGYRIEDSATGLRIDGAGGQVPRDVPQILDCGNSGTTARLALGFLTGEKGEFTLTGDSSLRSRPMERVAAPLRDLGADITTTGGRLPAIVRVTTALPGSAAGIVEAASAQVHAALALAALRSEQGIAVRRTASMRDHTLRLLGAFGVAVESEGEIDRFRPAAIDSSVEIVVPGDISSAAFFVCAALLVPGSNLRIDGVGLNPSRTQFLRALQQMGADIEWEILDERVEPIGAIVVRHGGDLRGIDLTDGGLSSDVPVAGMIDELPLLALMGAVTAGTTIVRGARELRVKESDRITATVSLLESLGLHAIEHEDGFETTGPQKIRGGSSIDHHGDHRLCMLAAVAALAAAQPVTIPNPDVASVSYPGFWTDLLTVSSTG